ncbi:hypothetical protein [Burkholderia pseudomallei]|uniref:hypothetical protein n=1 Tax=Burkholderia pseudomallei TaxID=28450 RepID=UPI001FCA5DCB|nr:hypothetical protein [Burkholderia pseudomallei]
MEPTMPHDNALTYANQPGNVGAWKLGEACRAAKAGGDPIDHGLSLLKELQARGYGVVDLAAHPGQPEPRAALLYEHDDGRYAVAPSAEEAHFTRDDPAWHRVGPVTVYGSNTAPHPEQRAEVTDDDKLCAELYRWLRERAWYVDAATYALGLRERWRNGDEPPPDADDVEQALAAARAGVSQ